MLWESNQVFFFVRCVNVIVDVILSVCEECARMRARMHYGAAPGWVCQRMVLAASLVDAHTH